MTLHMIGIGLYDEQDITLRGLETVKKCKKIYLESYTSILQCDIKKLEELYGKTIILADRELVEKNVEDTILKDAAMDDTAFLVIGDVFAATTHLDLFLRAKEMGIDIDIIHNNSILTAIGDVGLELYKFGKVTSIPFENDNVIAPYTVIRGNKGMHTLVLLDLRPDEEKFMTIKEACQYLIKKGIDENRLAVGCAGMGGKGKQIKKGTLKELQKKKFTKFPQCLIVVGDQLHFKEEEALALLPD